MYRKCEIILFLAFFCGVPQDSVLGPLLF